MIHKLCTTKLSNRCTLKTKKYGAQLSIPLILKIEIEKEKHYL